MMNDDNESARREQAARARERAAKAKAAAKIVRKNAVKKPAQHLLGINEFLRSQWVVGLAIGLVLGTQFKTFVDQFIASFIDPLLGLVLPGSGDLNKKTFAMSLGEEEAVFSYGAFISVLISFLTVVLVIYYLLKILKVVGDNENGKK